MAAHPAAGAAELSAAEARGRDLFHLGAIEGDPEIRALLGAERIEVPGAALPCAGCHGEDGRGRTEAGERAPNVRWAHLTRPYRSPPYDAQRITRAVTMGVDAAGDLLQPLMPRYRLTRRQATDLVAYLERLGEPHEPGVRDDAITIGTVLAPPDGASTVRAAVDRVLRAYFAEINGAGGVHGRRLELHELLVPAPSAKGVLGRSPVDRVFALTSVFVRDAPEAIAARVRELSVPTIGTLGGDSGLAGDPLVFEPFPGIDAQVRALARFAIRRRATLGASVAVLYPDSPTGRDRAASAQALWQSVPDLRHRALAVPAVGIGAAGFDPQELASRLLDGDPGVVLALTPGEVTDALAQALRARARAPVLLSPAELVSAGWVRLARAWPAQVYLAFSTLPADWSASGLDAYRRLGERFDLPRRQRGLQIAVLSNASVLVTALRRAGRDLTRAKLVSALEGLRDYETGLGPRVNFGPGRREGSRGAWVISARELSGEVAPVPVWME